MITGDMPVPVWPYPEATARVIAHEIGYLLGGQHQLSNCVEGDMTATPPEACTVMDGSLGLSTNFSTLNAALVRGFALEFADD